MKKRYVIANVTIEVEGVFGFRTPTEMLDGLTWTNLAGDSITIDAENARVVHTEKVGPNPVKAPR